MDTRIPIKEDLPLPIAAELLHIRIVGKSPDARDTRSLQATLNDVAHVLAMLFPIYYRDPVSLLPVKIRESVLTGARFDRGGDALVGADGSRYEHIMIMRADLEHAHDFLGASGNSIRPVLHNLL